MSNVIYVDPYGEAHTIDQQHEMAININTWFDDTFQGRIRVLVESLTAAWEAIKEAIKPAFEFVNNMIKGLKTSVITFVEMATIDQNEKKEQRRTWQQTNRNWECRLKTKYKQQMNFIGSKDWRIFKRYQRQRKI